MNMKYLLAAILCVIFVPLTDSRAFPGRHSGHGSRGGTVSGADSFPGNTDTRSQTTNVKLDIGQSQTIGNQRSYEPDTGMSHGKNETRERDGNATRSFERDDEIPHSNVERDNNEMRSFERDGERPLSNVERDENETRPLEGEDERPHGNVERDDNETASFERDGESPHNNVESDDNETIPFERDGERPLGNVESEEDETSDETSIEVKHMRSRTRDNHRPHKKEEGDEEEEDSDILDKKSERSHDKDGEKPRDEDDKWYTSDSEKDILNGVRSRQTRNGLQVNRGWVKLYGRN